jgi:predicted nucleic acid-binding protein
MAYYLLDTCIWRDFYENRFNYSGKNLGEEASNLFKKIINTKSKILFSESLYLELKKDYSLSDITNMLNLLFYSSILIKIEITKEEFNEAKKLSKERNLPFVDCLNAVQARSHNAIMVSRDKHFFKNLKDIVKTQRPSELI